MRRILVNNLLILCTIFTLSACNEEEIIVEYFCGDSVVVDSELYDATTTSHYSIVSVRVINQCVSIRISSGGCNGETWMATLVDSEDESLSTPPERFLKLNLENNEACLAVFEREFLFDTRSIPTVSSGTVILHLEGWDEPIIIHPS